MLTFPHYVAPSSIQGLGLFTAVDIPKNFLMWTFIPTFDPSWTPEQFERLPVVAQTNLKDFGWFDIQENLWHIGIDGDQYTNHSDTPNTYMDEDGCMRAAQDILAGSEVTSNYFVFDGVAEYKLSR